LDVAGGEATGGYAELALRAVGASRIVFGSDVPGRSVPSQVAKLLALDLPPDDREKVLWRNAAQVLGKRFPAAWRRQPPGARAGPAAPVVLATSRAGAGCVDVNSFLGEWPSRRLNGSPPADRALVLERRIELMDRLGIERAVVSPLDAVWLKDTDVANAELYRLLDGNPQAAGRVLPAYVLNPTWPAWSEQLERCLEEYGLAAGSGAVRLLPGYHGYGLDDDAVAPCLTRLAELDLPVIVTAQLEDSRMQHPSMRVDDVPLESIAAAVRRHPTLRWIVVNLVYSQILSLAKQLPAQARVWLDIARVQGPIDCLPQLRDAPGVGAQRLLFGTNLPLHVPEAPLLELLDARYSPEDDTAIRRGNAQSLFSAAIR
jgi:predicted TIM-barrel fold metal-dependent hydrolase